MVPSEFTLLSIPFFREFGKKNAYFLYLWKDYLRKEVWSMETTPQKYQQYVQQKQKKSPLGKDLALAFLIGGLICVLGQLIQNGYTAAGIFFPRNLFCSLKQLVKCNRLKFPRF